MALIGVTVTEPGGAIGVIIVNLSQLGCCICVNCLLDFLYGI